jgi:3-oxoacyl-[acyl-carrier protein] reductase
MSNVLPGARGIVTGASRGIGLELTVRLLARGASVAAVSRSSKLRERVMEEAQRTTAGVSGSQGVKIPPTEDRLVTVRGDLSDTDELGALVARCLEHWGGQIDFLVNNAGVADSKALEQTAVEDFDRHMRLNLYAPAELIRRARSALAASRLGVVVNVASASAHTGYEGQAAYVASKHALLGLSKVAARELAADGIRVHVVSPSATETSMLTEVRPDLEAAPGLLDPATVAEAILFLLQRGGEFGIDELPLRRPGKLPWS